MEYFLAQFDFWINLKEANACFGSVCITTNINILTKWERIVCGCFKLFDLMSLKIRWYRDICDGLSIISPHIQPSVNPSSSLRCVRFHRCSSCHVSPSDICLGLGSHLWMWWGFFFFRALLLMWTTTCSAEGRSCLQYTPTSLFPLSAWNFMSLSLTSIFHAIGRHPRLQLKKKTPLWVKTKSHHYFSPHRVMFHFLTHTCIISLVLHPASMTISLPLHKIILQTLRCRQWFADLRPSSD